MDKIKKTGFKLIGEISICEILEYFDSPLQEECTMLGTKHPNPRTRVQPPRTLTTHTHCTALRCFLDRVFTSPPAPATISFDTVELREAASHYYCSSTPAVCLVTNDMQQRAGKDADVHHVPAICYRQRGWAESLVLVPGRFLR